jgi:ketosteroid isomerase-like protein
MHHRLAAAMALALSTTSLWTAQAGAETPAPVAAVLAAVQSFHHALKLGDAQAAAGWLAADAVVLESGERETREAYIAHHLKEDIAFARAVPSRPDGAPVVTVLGEAAWVQSVQRSQGTWQGKPLNLAGAELMVLSLTPEGWRIRAIHWSSHAVR